jgi:WD40 repeat protein
MRPYREFAPRAVSTVKQSGQRTFGSALLALTVIEGDDLPVDEKQAKFWGRGYRVVFYGCSVSPEGRVSYFQNKNGDSKNSGYPVLSAKTLQELRRLLLKVPDDHSRLPPAGRRLVIQTTATKQLVVRVYDRANLPDSVLEIIRTSRADIKPWSLQFAPEKVGSESEFSKSGIQVPWPRPTSPDGSLYAAQGYYEIVISSPKQPALRELREPEVNRHIDGLFGAFFTPDGRFLLVQSTHPAIRIYDTKTWEQVESLPNLPTDAVAYFPDTDWRLAVFASSAGKIGLWDSGMRREIAQFGTGAELLDAAFSPDHSLVAVATQEKNEANKDEIRVRVWRVDGGLLSELRPSDQIQPLGLSRFSRISGLLAWWSDSQHLLSIVRPDGFFTNHNLALWDVKTGRYRGELSGCTTSIDRFMVSPQTGLVFADCYLSGLCMWNGFSDTRRVTEFEWSLAHQD